MPSGFRRMSLYPSAVDPAVVLAWLDPSSASGPRDASNHMASAAGSIADIGAASPWFKIHDFECDAEVAHLIALDVEGGSERMQAIVARAYVRADAYADRLAERLEDREFAKGAADDLRKALKMLVGDGHGQDGTDYGVQFEKGEGVLQRTLDVISRHRIDRTGAQDNARRADADLTINFLSRFASDLDAVKRMRRRADDARLVFLMSLGEAYSLATGQPLRFHGYDAKRESNAWYDLVTDTFELTGLSSGALFEGGGGSSLDQLLRRLGGGEGKFARERYHADLDFVHLAERFRSETVGRRLVVIGDLPSTGYLIDFGI